MSSREGQARERNLSPMKQRQRSKNVIIEQLFCLNKLEERKMKTTSENDENKKQWLYKGKKLSIFPVKEKL